uniref:Mitochondrial uncoupling protein 4 n=1 Tax=Syphacia muris TaxID=451379 RepID=A0A0N5AFE8_9BILA
MPRIPGDGKDSPLTLRSILIKYILSCSASLVSETVTYPLDVTKTRLQMIRNAPQSSALSLRHTGRPGMFSVFFGIVKREGVLSLWNGVTPAIYRHFVYTGFRMGSYEVLRAKWHDKEREKRFPIWKSMICGLTAGAFAQFVASPTDLVKVQMQMEGLRRLQGQPTRFKNVWDAFSSFYRVNGFRSLWTGWIPNCQRAALLNMADLATYDRAKRILLGHGMSDNAFTHACSSAMSGFAAATVSTPADVIKTRIMNQLRHSTDVAVNEGYHYKGAFDCLRHTIRNEGFLALYKGFLPTYIRMAPWSLTFWISYEKIRQITGISSF